MVKRRNMRDPKLSILDSVTNKMEVNGYVFHTRVEDWIGAKILGVDVVTIKHRWVD